MADIEDLGPQLNVVVWMLLGSSGLFLALRLYCKFLKNRGFWWDDHLLVASWLALALDVVCVSISISLGFGRHVIAINPQHLPTIQIYGDVSASAAILAAAWSKTSFGLTLLRIAGGRTKVVVWAIIVSMNLLMGVHALMPWIQCDPVSKGWNRGREGRCWDARVGVVYGVVAGSYSGVMDIVLAILPWTVIGGLQMKRKEKIGVAVAMSMGVFAGCTAFVKSAKIPLLADGDFTFQGYNLAAWGAAEVATTIMASSIPVLRVLIREVKATVTNRRLYGRSSSSDDDSYQKKGEGYDYGYGAGAGDDDTSLARSNTVISATKVPSKRGGAGRGGGALERLKSLRKKPRSESEGVLDPGSTGNGGILQTQVVEVQYHEREEGDVGGVGDNRV
ncbi:hypothetical protein GE09DRAFT_15318 [Coniochaeta sp. 2T2.1]|nr:hypothetical protein GE09DRAFT_15318 [Coniochaeta sp. 2T2.1]